MRCATNAAAVALAVKHARIVEARAAGIRRAADQLTIDPCRHLTLMEACHSCAETASKRTSVLSTGTVRLIVMKVLRAKGCPYSRLSEYLARLVGFTPAIAGPCARTIEDRPILRPGAARPQRRTRRLFLVMQCRRQASHRVRRTVQRPSVRLPRGRPPLQLRPKARRNQAPGIDASA
jgi:hypothetical protein